MNILDKAIVLKLNKAWQPISQCTVRQAITDLAGGNAGRNPVMAMDIAYTLNEVGDYDLSQVEHCIPVGWEDWLELPVRECDLSIRAPGREVRIPTVVIARNYSGMPEWRPSATRSGIYERDEGICQYTGRKVGWRDGNLDHVLPRSRGGQDSFENLVWSDKRINTRKSNRTPCEAGLKLIRYPATPRALPMSAKFQEAKHRDWRWFLINK